MKFYVIKSKSDADLKKLNLFKVDRDICNLIGEPTSISENSYASLSVEVNADEQEKKLKLTKSNPLREVTIHHKAGPAHDDGLDYEEVCTLVKSHVGHVRLQLELNIKVVAVRCQLDRMYTICNVHKPATQCKTHAVGRCRN